MFLKLLSGTQHTIHSGHKDTGKGPGKGEQVIDDPFKCERRHCRVRTLNIPYRRFLAEVPADGRWV